MDAYIYAADVYCEDCARDIRRRIRSEGFGRSDDSNEWPQGPYSESMNESDYPQHCGSHDDCLNAITLADGHKVGAFLENNLTTHGRQYVIDSHREDPSEITQLWVDFYDLAGDIETDDDQEED